jgi:hypothetical protein
MRLAAVRAMNVGVHVDENQANAFAGKGQRSGPANPACRTGYQRNFPIQVSHAKPPILSTKKREVCHDSRAVSRRARLGIVVRD